MQLFLNSDFLNQVYINLFYLEIPPKHTIKNGSSGQSSSHAQNTWWLEYISH